LGITHAYIEKSDEPEGDECRLPNVFVCTVGIQKVFKLTGYMLHDRDLSILNMLRQLLELGIEKGAMLFALQLILDRYAQPFGTFQIAARGIFFNVIE
jgi:hypothetical protein